MLKFVAKKIELDKPCQTLFQRKRPAQANFRQPNSKVSRHAGFVANKLLFYQTGC
jgi:hypothetical protein